MKKTILIISLVLSVYSIGLVSAQNQNYGNCGFGTMMYDSYGQGFMYLGGISYILFIGLMIAGIYWLIKNSNGNDRKK